MWYYDNDSSQVHNKLNKKHSWYFVSHASEQINTSFFFYRNTEDLNNKSSKVKMNTGMLSLLVLNSSVLLSKDQLGPKVQHRANPKCETEFPLGSPNFFFLILMFQSFNYQK